MGTAVIINGIDFGERNLGKVTFQTMDEKANSIVSTYITKIGGDETYRPYLFKAVLRLLLEGMWDKVAGIYPMLGNSLEYLKVNLKEVEPNRLAFPEKGFDMDFGPNIGAGQNKALLLNTSFMSHDNKNYIADSLKNGKNKCIYMSFKRNTWFPWMLGYSGQAAGEPNEYDYCRYFKTDLYSGRDDGHNVSSGLYNANTEKMLVLLGQKIQGITGTTDSSLYIDCNSVLNQYTSTNLKDSKTFSINNRVFFYEKTSKYSVGDTIGEFYMFGTIENATFEQQKIFKEVLQTLEMELGK